MRVKRINIVRYVLSVLCFWLILIASLPATAGEVNVKKLCNYKWTKAESQSFIVVSNASRKQTQLMLEELENFSFFMSKLLGYKQKVLERKVPVILVKSGTSFSSLGISGEYAGVFTPRDDGIIYARADKFRASSKGAANWGRLVVLQSLVHLLNNNSSIGLASPPWYKNGIAEYFGTYTQKKNKIVVGEL